MNTEATFSVSITGDEAISQKLKEFFTQINVSVRDQPAKFAIADQGEGLLRIHAGNNLSVKEIKEHLKGQQVEYGYFINVLPEEGSEEQRRGTKTGVIQTARYFNYFTRETPFSGLTKEVFEHDLLNSIYLLTAPETGEDKKFIIKRYLDATIFMDEFSLSFAREACFKKHSLEEKDMNLYELFPVSLNSALLPRSSFDHLRALNKVQNHLWMKISSDPDFLLEQCKELEKDDEFVGNFISILRKVKESKTAQRAKCGITRNDFIVDKSGQPLQVEFNLYASSLGPISEKHSNALFNIGLQNKDVTSHDLENYQTGENEDFLARAMEAAWRWYGKPKAVVVLVSGKEKNVIDQFAAANKLANKGIKMLRYSFEEMDNLLELDSETGVATVAGNEVALFYFRSGYMPNHYKENDWAVREKIELSKALKCPDVAQTLVNMKFFQYIINKSETWTRFGFDTKEFEDCRKLYCSILTFTDFDSDRTKMLKYINEHGGVQNWVLKPQREGGANNIFGEEIEKVISESSDKELHSYILMAIINPSMRTGIQCTWDKLDVRSVIDEIGLFHSFLTDGDKILEESVGGSLVRSKVQGTHEGGVAFGYSVINSVKLTF